MVNMFQNCSFLPAALSSSLPHTLAQLVAELEAALRECVTEVTEKKRTDLDPARYARKPWLVWWLSRNAADGCFRRSRVVS